VLQPSRLYSLFDMAEKKGLSVAKLLTGRDAPLTNIEVTLHNTYIVAAARFSQQYSKSR
jgi:hypothetical protein